jgi:hypothetical protein
MARRLPFPLSSIHKHCQPSRSWTLHEETRMYASGFILLPLPSASLIRAGRRISEAEQAAGLVGIACLCRLQPDKRIAIFDLCRASDVHADQFIA